MCVFMNRGIKTTQTNGKYWSFNVSIVEGTLWELSQINISGILASDESDKAPKLEGLVVQKSLLC